MTVRTWVPLAAFAALAGLLLTGLSLKPREVPSPLIGLPAPAFVLPRLQPPHTDLSPADMKGRVWLLNVWASWCVACRQEHPVLVELAREGLVDLVGLDYKDDPRDALESLRRQGDPYAVTAVDASGRTGIDYGVYGVPETFVIDRQGIVRFKHIGPLTQDVWATQLRPLIRTLQR